MINIKQSLSYTLGTFEKILIALNSIAVTKIDLFHYGATLLL